MDKNPPANAGDMGLIPGPGRPRMWQGNQARAPQLLKPTLESLGTATTEGRVPGACAPQQEKPRSLSTSTREGALTHSHLDKAHAKQ